MSVRSALAHRNLLYLLSLKELRTRYRQSLLGWAWSLLNPLSQMVIFSIIFIYVFKQEPPTGADGIQVFPLYFLVGLIPFQFFSISVTAAMGAVQGGSSLIKKVAFPHEHLVFSVIIAQFVTMLIEFGVLTVALLIAGTMPLPWIPVLLVLLLIVALFTTGVALALSAANVFFHDVSYLWSIVAQVLFYSTPIIYVARNIEVTWLRGVTNWGPTGSFVRAAHEIMYEQRMPGLGRWGHLLAISLFTFALGAWIFDRLSPKFAEEL